MGCGLLAALLHKPSLLGLQLALEPLLVDLDQLVDVLVPPLGYYPLL